MRLRLHFKSSRIRELLQMAAWAFGALVLLTFPMRSAHQYTNHFRTPEVRRSIERHIFVAHTNLDPAERISQQSVLRTIVVPLDGQDAISPLDRSQFRSLIPISHLLSRLKLGSSRSDSQDPLL
jgi:hypothetical protein